MRTRSRRTAALSGLAALAIVATACGGSSSGGGGGGGGGQTGGSGATTVNSASVKSGGTLTYVLEKNVPAWNVNTSTGNTFENAEVVENIYPMVFSLSPDLTNVTLNKDFVESATQTSASPQTIVYKLNPAAKWSDGVPINADDFIYYWKAQDGKDCPKCDAASNTGYDQIKSITGSGANNQTVTVVFAKPFGDWKSLFGCGYPLLPAHIAAKHGTMADSWNKYFNDTVPNVTAGPFKIQSFKSNQAVTLVRDTNYWGTQAKLDKLIFRIITDTTAEPTALQNHEVDAIYPQPEVDLINQLNGMKSQGVTYQLDLGLQWEHFDFNLKNKFLQDKPLRQALFTAVDRQGLIDRTVGQVDSKVQVLNNRFLMPAQEGYQDDVTQYGLGQGDVAKAKQILTTAGYTGVGTALKTKDGTPVAPLTMKYTVGNPIRQTECQLFAHAAAQLGVKVNVSTTDDLGATLTHADKQHDYDVVVFAWVGNPFFTSSNAPNYQTGSGNNFGGYSNPQVDSLLKQAIAATDRTKQVQLDNQVDQLISQDAYTLPLYQKPTILAFYTKWGNIRDNATGQGPPYNAYEWGLKQGAS